MLARMAGSEPDPDKLLALVTARMPFGRFQGSRLIHLPDAYLVWFAQRGFPSGLLGQQLREVYELKANGLGPLLARVAARVDGEGE